MSRIVVDASVAVKWVLREEHGATARRVLSTRQLLAPHLLWAEVGNTLWKRHRRRESSLEEARRMLADIRELQVTTFAHWPLLPAALDLAMSLDQTVYDCLYLALAEQRNSVMVTADRRFHEAVSSSIWADRIVWIEDVA
ncbi:MAG: type II toxin-antitoxin system VapC family toxin [Geminicoccaceae bacterium]